MLERSIQNISGDATGVHTRTRVKICGITRPEDGVCAARLGADAIGLVFFPPSPRAVTVEQARAVLAQLPPLVTVVGVFVNEQPERVRAVLEAVPLHLLQFHGDETPEECARYDRPWMKAIRMRDEVDLRACARRYGDARALLVDAWRPDKWGGSGRTFDWSLIRGEFDKPLMLAGGLTPENVAEAVRRVRPWAVDVSGGVECAGGIKDAARMAAFIREVSGVATCEAEA